MPRLLEQIHYVGQPDLDILLVGLPGVVDAEVLFATFRGTNFAPLIAILKMLFFYQWWDINGG